MSISAKDYALRTHVGKRFGKDPYGNYLKAVVEVLTDYGYKDEWVSAGWLCDSIKLNIATVSSLRTIFGIKIAALVESSTPSGVLPAAQIQSLCTKIKSFPEAAILAVAKRIAEVEASSPSSLEFSRYVSQHKKLVECTARYVPYPMMSRLTREMDIRRAVMTLAS